MDIVKAGLKKTATGAGALLGMKLHTDRLLHANSRRKAILFMRRPRNHRAIINGLAHVAIRVIGNRERRTSEQRLASAWDHFIPSHLRYALCFESHIPSWNDAKPSVSTLVTRVAEE